MDRNEIDINIREIAKGNMEALEKLYQEFKKDIYIFAISICHNRELAEDVVQDTYVAIWNNAENYTVCGSGKRWMMGIARNISMEYLRKNNKADNTDEFESYEKAGGSFESSYILFQLLHELDDVEKQIVVLHVIVGLKHREISDMMNIPIGTVLWRYRISLQKLKKIIERE